MQFGEFLITIAPVPEEPSGGGCVWALFKLFLWIVAIRLVFKIFSAIFSFIASNILWILLAIAGLLALYMYIKNRRKVHHFIFMKTLRFRKGEDFKDE